MSAKLTCSFNKIAVVGAVSIIMVVFSFLVVHLKTILILNVVNQCVRKPPGGGGGFEISNETPGNC